MDKTIWYLDSGASLHICGDSTLFTDFTELTKPIKINTTGRDAAVYATARGTVKIEELREEAWTKWIMSDVLYMEGSVNMFSAVVLTDNRYSVTLRHDIAFFERHVGPWADRDGKMCVMRFRKTTLHSWRCQQRDDFYTSGLLIST